MASKVTRRSVVKGVAAVGGAAAISPFFIGTASAQMKKMVFITPFKYLAGFMPVLNADTGGHFANAGLDAEILPGNGAAQAVQQVLSGRAAIGRASSIDIVNAVGNQGAPLISFSTVKQSSPFFVTSRKDNPIDSPKDMVGKVIGITSSGGGTENLLDMMLEKHGIPHKSVERQVVGNAAGAFSLIEAGRIACYMPSTGSVVTLRETGQPIHAWNTDREVPMPGQIYFCTTETLEKNPEMLVSFLRGVRASLAEVRNADLKPVLTRIAEKYDLIGIKNLDILAIGAKAELDTWFEEGDDNILRNVPRRWDSITNAMVSVKLAKPVKASTLYTNKLVDQANA
jgi:NitT/TauT family transport system substrate-binding protein